MKKRKFQILIVLVLITITFSQVHLVLAKTAKPTVKKATAEKVTPKERTITLDVPNHTYTGKFKDGSTAYDAMVVMQKTKTNNFSFRSKNYGDLGNFVDEINGVKGTPGKYWIYYINNKKATLGASKYVLKEGDRISWKQEGF